MDAKVDILGISKRLQKLPGWKADIEPTRDRMMKEARKQGMVKADAQSWTYAELDRLYPAAVPGGALPHTSGGGVVHSKGSAISPMAGPNCQTMPACRPRSAGFRHSDYG
jgi:hypothetical protein